MIKKKILTFMLTFFLLAGSPGLLAGKTYGEAKSDAAEQGLLKALEFYKRDQRGELTCWEELLAIYGTGEIGAVDLREWRLPPVPKADKTVKSYLPAIITSLIRGVDTSQLIVELLSKSNSGQFSEYADAQAFAMLGLAVAGEENCDKSQALYLISLQDAGGGFIGEYDGDCVTNDTTGIAALALAPYAGEPEFKESVAAIVEFFEREQLEEGGFNYYYAASQWGPSGSYESANSTALAVWGLTAIKGITDSDDLKARIDSILIQALPALLKWQNADGSFGFDPTGNGSFDSLTSRQIMIALCMMAGDGNLFADISLSKSVFLDFHVRIESDAHYPIDVFISPEKGESVHSLIGTAWRKAGIGVYEPDSYIYCLNDEQISLSSTVEKSDGEVIAIGKEVIKRAAFQETVIVGEMNEAQTVLLKDRETGLPLSEVIITINGHFIGYDPDTGQPLCTKDDGSLIIPADKFLAAGSYLVSTSQEGISKDLCTILINRGERSSRNVGVRIEGIDKTILSERRVLIETSGDKVPTAFDAVKKALEANDISSEIIGGYIYMIDDICDHYFELQGESYDFWNFYVNGRPSALGIDSYAVDEGDEVLLYYGNKDTILSEVDWNYSQDEKTLTVSLDGFIYDFSSGNRTVTPISGALITIFGEGNFPAEVTTNEHGTACFQGIEAGSYSISAVKYDSLVSKDGFYLPQIVMINSDYIIQIPNHVDVWESGSVIDLSDVSADYPLSISVLDKVNAYIKVNAASNAELPYIKSENIKEGTGLLIERGTKILLPSENWDGNIALPVPVSVSLPGKTVFAAVHAGCDKDIVFDRPVRMIIPDAAGKKAGFIDSSGTFTEITKTLTSDCGDIVNNQLADAAAGRCMSDSDIIIWTKHLSTFVAYADSSGGQAERDLVSLRVIGYNGNAFYDMLKKTQIEISGKDTPYSILEKAGLTVGGSHNYVSSINGLSEMDYGSQSGWKYSVNGDFSSLSADSYILVGGDYVIWRFVTDADDSRQDTMPFEDPLEEEDILYFSDVDSSFWFAPSVNHLAKLGLISGKSEGLFMPFEKITRAELAVILFRMAGADFGKYGKDSFIDVGEKDWFADAVAWAKEAGVFAGIKKKDGSYEFKPNAYVSREDLAAVIYRYSNKAAGKIIARGETGDDFTDRLQISDYAGPAVLALQSAGIINGIRNKDGSICFLPKSYATRAEAAQVISAFLNDITS